jgi:hypothetical protein
LPQLQKLYDKYREQGFLMGGMNTVDDQTDLIPEWRARHRFTFPILVGATEEMLREYYHYLALPLTLLVDSQGRTLIRILGPTLGTELMEAEIRELLELDPSGSSTKPKPAATPPK